MNSKSLARLVVIAVALFLPALASAQEAAISGSITDSTGGVLPGVVIRAVHQATGNSFEAVTDGSGAFRMSVRVGLYEITAELSGFSTVSRRLELLVGQLVAVNLQLSPSSVEESVTVSAVAPLVDTS